MTLEDRTFTRARFDVKMLYDKLEPGGSIEFNVQNFDRIIIMYHNGQWSADFATALSDRQRQDCTIQGQPNRALWLGLKLRLSNYDWPLLKSVCEEAGFTRFDIIALEPNIHVIAWKNS